MSEYQFDFTDFYRNKADQDALVPAFHVFKDGPQISLQAQPMGEDSDKGVLGYATQLRDGSIVVIITRPGAKLGVSEEQDA